MQDFIELELLITELRSVLYSINISYSIGDVTSCTESASYILQIFANIYIFATLRDIVQ